MPPPDFDRIAPWYRWLEYLALGPILERVRFRHLRRLPQCQRALILGDGDGRFTAQLLAQQPKLQVDVVDSSATMLRLLSQRCRRSLAEASGRLTLHHVDARTFQPAACYDLVVTHFFLDCLREDELSALVARVGRQLRPGALWLVSEFSIPRGWMHLPARAYVRALYFAFRLLTGLRVSQLPDYAAVLRLAGGTRQSNQCYLFGLLVSELWSFHTAVHDSETRTT